MKLTDIILENTGRPKVIVMSGGAGAGKSYLLNQLNLSSLPIVNPDKYVEDPDHPSYNNLSQASRLANKEAEELSNNKKSYVWDTTASNPKKIKELIDKGYDVYMVMVYTHPMISYISNFSRKRNIPGTAVFSTWRNVYELISDYNKMLKGNFSIFVNTRGGKYEKEIKAFDTAAKNGAAGISDYLSKYNKQLNIGQSSFRKPIEMSKQEEEEFFNAVRNVDYDVKSYGEERALKKAFVDNYRKNGVSPGDDKLKDVVKKYRSSSDKNAEKAKQVLDNIADMLYSPVFQEKLKHSSPAEIDQKVQAFLA
tara:strand:+ start:7849 stop:8775 length:927 start_codon:yes stop_codon:yes gene_type:complete